MTAAWVQNPARDHRWTCEPVPADVQRFHRGLPEYAPTPLVDLPDLARELGVGHVFAKDESHRLGLPAFKALGASWAIHRALRDDDGAATVVAATDGNHGRAVARFAHRLGRRAHIIVPDGVHPAAVQAIRDEGATVAHVPGSYDHAVRTAAERAAATGSLLIQDTSWDGYTEIPGWIVDGYATLFAEVDDQLRDAGAARPDLVVVPTGVGSLLQAALTHHRSSPDRLDTRIFSVEPVHSACVLAGIAAGEPVAVDTRPTVMAGLNCGTVSPLAWPLIERGLDAAIAVSDGQATVAAHDLAALGVLAGPCGAATLAAVRTAVGVADGGRGRADLRLSPTVAVVLLVTEGAAANPHLERTDT